jgi:hypothetical protein
VEHADDPGFRFAGADKGGEMKDLTGAAQSAVEQARYAGKETESRTQVTTGAQYFD